MFHSHKEILKIASVYIGTVLGAGFASGQEIVQFFTSYGFKGIYGLIVSSVLLSLIGGAILELSYIYKIRRYNELIYLILGKSLGDMMQFVVTLYLGVVFIVMLAATGALAEQYFHLAFSDGVIGICILCFFTFLYGMNGIVAAHSILAPILFFLGILLGFHIMIFKDTATFGLGENILRVSRNWFISCILYVSYNTITTAVILPSMGGLLSSRRNAKIGGILGGACLGIFGLLLGTCTLLFLGEIHDVEMPILKIVSYYSPYIQYIYIAILLIAMFTTAASTGYGFIDRLSPILPVNKAITIAFFLMFSFWSAHIGFSNLIETVYPFFGFIGIFQVVLLLLHFFLVRNDIESV